MKIVFVSHTFFGPYFVVGSHHLARQFARLGHTVWHISPIPFIHIIKPLSDYRTRLKRFSQGVLELEPNLKEAVVRPLLPWQLTRRFLKAGNYFLKISDIGMLTRAYPELKDVDILMIDEPRLHGIENYIRAKSIYYRPTDLYADMKHDKQIEKTESALLSGCRGLIATSEPVLERMLTQAKSIPHLVLTNGVDDSFSKVRDEPDALRAIGKPRVVYVGAIDERLDLAAIEFLARRFPLVNFIVIGQGSRSGELQAMAGMNIYALGPIPFGELPAYLQHCDIGILPLVKSPSNEGRSPMKLYEYGLSGLSVLASRTSELDRRTEDFIKLYFDYEDAVRLLGALLAAKPDRKEIAQQCSHQAWPQKAQTLEKFIRDTSKLPTI